MPSFLAILTLYAALLTSTILASPVSAVAATKTTSCSPDSTFNAKFDKLAAGSAPTAGFMDASWSGWTVTNASDYGVDAKSGDNVIQSADSETSTITTDKGVVMELVSFYFACVFPFPNSDQLIPIDCDIMVTSIPYTNLLTISSAGPFGFSVNFTAYENMIPAPMSRVDLNVGSSEYYFQVVSGPPGSFILLDNVVMEQANSCSY